MYAYNPRIAHHPLWTVGDDKCGRFQKMAFCTLFVKDGVVERVALDLRLHDDALDHAGNLSTTLITFSDAYINKCVQCAKHFNA